MTRPGRDRTEKLEQLKPRARAARSTGFVGIFRTIALATGAATLSLACTEEQRSSAADPGVAGGDGDSNPMPQAPTTDGSAGSDGSNDGATGGAAGQGEPAPVPAPDSDYADNFVQRSRYQDSTGNGGPTFVEITDVEVSGDHVFLCTATKGLMVVDRASPELVITGLFPSSHDAQFPRCQHVRIDGDIVSITNRGDELAATPHLTLYDATDKTALVQVATVSDPDASYEGHMLLAAGIYAVALHGAGLAIFERDGATLEEKTRLGGFDNAWDMVRAGDTLLVANGAAGVAMVDVSDPLAPSLSGKLALPGAVKHLEIDGDLAFAAAGAEGVHVLDVSEPAKPVLITTIETPGSALMSGYADSMLHVADWNDVRVFDVSEPLSPKQVAVETVQVNGFARVLAIDAAGKNSYIGEWTGLYDFELGESADAPDIRVPAFEVNFPTTDVGEVSAFTLLIENEGTAPLSIKAFNVSSGETEFQALLPDLTIPSGKRDFVELRFTPTDNSTAEGTLTLVSDDPDEGALEVRLEGNSSGLAVGDALPDYTWRDIETDEEISTTSLKGKVAVLSYFATF